MLHSNSRLLTPIAAAFGLALASGGAVAAIHVNPHQQYTQDQQTSSNAQNTQNAQSTDTFREGQLWATYVINPALQSYHLMTDVDGSKVTLRGIVDTKAEKLLAGAIAQQVKGISTVDNEINIASKHIVVTTFIPANVFAQHVQNVTTNAEINSRLLWNEYTDGLDIDVKSRGGKVTLTGTADTAKAKRRAGRIAANTVGVQAVDNRLTVTGKNVAGAKSGVDDDWITDKIRTSYIYADGTSTRDIKVSVNDGTVSLSGTVDNDMERQRAITIAQHIRGVDAVNANDLRVDPDLVATSN